MFKKSTVGTAQIAALLGINRQTVRGMFERGEIAGARFGKKGIWKASHFEYERLERELHSRGSSVQEVL
jgi:excisionase family DNA binding protein